MLKEFQQYLDSKTKLKVVRTEALRYMSRHDEMDPLTYIDRLGDFADFSVRSATISFLMKPGEAHNPEAARMILDGMIRDLDNAELASQAANSISLLGDIPVEALRSYLAASGELESRSRSSPGPSDPASSHWPA